MKDSINIHPKAPTGERYLKHLLSKAELLEYMEYIPQGYWPPRRTRQSSATIRAAVYRAATSPVCGEEVRKALRARILEKWGDVARVRGWVL